MPTYTPTQWETGDIIVKSLLNHAEEGIADATEKIATGTIDITSKTVTVAYNGVLLDSRAVLDGEEIMVDKIVVGQSVIFSLAEEPSDIVYCYVLYV